MKKKLAGLIFTGLFMAGMIAAADYFGAMESPGYRITQYGRNDGPQAMFYTIEDSEGNVALVDGGWDQDAETVLKVIMDHESHIDSWILTHPHQDHISAFLNLMEGDFDFSVDHIYAIDLDYDRYRSVVNSADGGFEFYERFLEVAGELDNVIYVHTGDRYDVLGLDMEILNAYDRDSDWYDMDPANTGSMMFRLRGKKQSMLFCADVTRALQKKLIDKYGESLSSDYVQLSHHGILACMGKGIYEYVDPEAVFFDLPEHMNLSPDYNAVKLYDFFAERGCTIYNFGTAPNTVELR